MKLRKTGLFTTLVILGLIVYACVALVSIRQKIAAATETEAALREKVTQMQENNASLQYDIDHADDPDVIAGIARQKLGLVTGNEIIFYDGGQ